MLFNKGGFTLAGAPGVNFLYLCQVSCTKSAATVMPSANRYGIWEFFYLVGWPKLKHSMEAIHLTSGREKCLGTQVLGGKSKEKGC